MTGSRVDLDELERLLPLAQHTGPRREIIAAVPALIAELREARATLEVSEAVHRAYVDGEAHDTWDGNKPGPTYKQRAESAEAQLREARKALDQVAVSPGGERPADCNAHECVWPTCAHSQCKPTPSGAEIVRELRARGGFMAAPVDAALMIRAADFIEQSIGHTKGASKVTDGILRDGALGDGYDPPSGGQSSAAERNPTSDGGLAAGPDNAELVKRPASYQPETKEGPLKDFFRAVNSDVFPDWAETVAAADEIYRLRQAATALSRQQVPEGIVFRDDEHTTNPLNYPDDDGEPATTTPMGTIYLK